ncbi:MAG TPA: septal ring lytic transglycosylase RlpA family protein [Acidobacteriaceae bacterium]|nr:septal ring lytic transglycosylase RlpA family protein [Acidobacteriaceae bacterium]
MERTAFKRVHIPASGSFHKLAAGALFAALAFTASANGGASPATQRPTHSPSTKAHNPRHWYQVGIASWYGAHFQGRTTAAGEAYDMNQLTCAHPTLPMGTWLRVTNLHNRKSTFVRVNDRGPVVNGRIVDLSYAAARVIGLSGVGRVKIEQVHQNDPALAEALVAQLQFPTLFRPAGSLAR